MAIGFSEWNQRNSDTERRTMVPNLWGPGMCLVGVALWFAGTVAYAGGMRAVCFDRSMAIRRWKQPFAQDLCKSGNKLKLRYG